MGTPRLSIACRLRRGLLRRGFGQAALVASALLSAGVASAQPLQPGEAYVTRFSGFLYGAAGPIIDLNGTVGSIIDVRAPGQAPQGTHWIYEPQRSPVTAGQIGQVFGVVLDDANPPNVYLASTSATTITVCRAGQASLTPNPASRRRSARSASIPIRAPGSATARAASSSRRSAGILRSPAGACGASACTATRLATRCGSITRSGAARRSTIRAGNTRRRRTS